MGEAFRQGMYVYVGGILFCIAAVILMLFITGMIEMNNGIRTAHETVYDLNRDYNFNDR